MLQLCLRGCTVIQKLTDIILILFDLHCHLCNPALQGSQLLSCLLLSLGCCSKMSVDLCFFFFQFGFLPFTVCKLCLNIVCPFFIVLIIHADTVDLLF